MYYLDLELLIDGEGNYSGNARLGMDVFSGGFQINPFLEAKLKSKKYNSYYYGLTLEDVNPGIEFSLGIVADYHLISNFYFFGAAKFTLLDKNVRNLSFVKRNNHLQAFLGIGFSNDRSRPKKPELDATPYLRLSHGWATPTDLAKIIRFQARKDSNNNQLTSIFYGHPLTDDFFSLPIHFYITAGFVWHWAKVRSSVQEIDIAIKLYYTFPLPVRVRFGAAEGISYVNDIPDVEAREMERKGYKPSNLMNFLDFTLDLNIGDIFGGQELDKWWIGYGIHHRSSIFETAQQFGRISGGSNFQTITLLRHF
jgi:outer membrane protein